MKNIKNYKLYGLITVIIIMLTIITSAYYNKNKVVWIDKLLPITNVKTDKKIVAIAFNVYEGNDEIKKILSILNKRKIKASFFIGGVWARSNNDMIKILKNEEQDIQNHGYLHKNPTVLNSTQNIEEVVKTEKLIYDICGIRTNLFEPPSGDYDENTLKIMNSIGYKVVTWSIDTIDWRDNTTKTLIKSRIKKKLSPGAIILMHPKKVTADSLEEVIEYLYSEGYEVTSVSNLINSN